MPKLLNELSPKERVDAIIKFMPYLIPKMDIETEKLQNKDDEKNNYLINLFKLHHQKEQNKTQSELEG